MAIILRLKVTKRRLFEKVSLERCISANVNIVNLSNDLPSLSPSWRSKRQNENYISEKNLEVSGSVTQCKHVMQFVSQLFNFLHAMAKIFGQYCDNWVSLLIINTAAVTCLPSILLIEGHAIDCIINKDAFEFPRCTNLYTIKTTGIVCVHLLIQSGIWREWDKDPIVLVTCHFKPLPKFYTFKCFSVFIIKSTSQFVKWVQREFIWLKAWSQLFKVDDTIHHINHYPKQTVLAYPLDSDLCGK